MAMNPNICPPGYAYAPPCPHCGMYAQPQMGTAPAYAPGYAPAGPYAPPYGAPMAPYGYGPGYGMGYAGLPTDEDITNMVYDSIDSDPLIPFDADITVNVDAGEVTLSGTVVNKRIKHAAGEDSWWVPGVVDVHNQIKVQKKERERPAA